MNDVYGDDNTDLQSLSDTSDISSLSENNLDALTFDLRDDRTLGQPRSQMLSSGYKSSIGKTGKLLWIKSFIFFFVLVDIYADFSV